MKKRGVLRLDLQFNFWIAMTIATHCNSTPINIIEQVAWVARNATHSMYNLILMQLITTQLQLSHNNSFSTTMQLRYDYNHNVTLTSYFMHSSKFNTWHTMKIFGWIFLKYWYPSSIRLFILDDLKLWHVAQSKVAMWHIHWI
jgi:hypothetical protein